MSKTDKDEKAKFESPESTKRTARVQFKNEWGTTLATVTVRHRYDNDPNKTEETTWNNIDPGDTSPGDAVLWVTYWTGVGTKYDYWWVKIEQDNGDVYQSKENFYCYLTADDDGGLVEAIVDGQAKVFRIVPPASSACSTASMEKQ